MSWPSWGKRAFWYPWSVLNCVCVWGLFLQNSVALPWLGLLHTTPPLKSLKWMIIIIEPRFFVQLATCTRPTKIYATKCCSQQSSRYDRGTYVYAAWAPWRVTFVSSIWRASFLLNPDMTQPMHREGSRTYLLGAAYLTFEEFEVRKQLILASRV